MLAYFAGADMPSTTFPAPPPVTVDTQVFLQPSPPGAGHDCHHSGNVPAFNPLSSMTCPKRSQEPEWVQADLNGSQDQLTLGAAGPSAGRVVLIHAYPHMPGYPSRSLDGNAWPL